MAGLQIFAVDRSARIPILKVQADKVREEFVLYYIVGFDCISTPMTNGNLLSHKYCPVHVLFLINSCLCRSGNEMYF